MSGRVFRHLFLSFLLSLLLGAGSCVANYAPVSRGSFHVVTPGYYHVRGGDTLYSIAWAHNLDFRVLASMNGISKPYAIHPGQKLTLKRRRRSRERRSKQHSSWHTHRENKKILPTSHRRGVSKFTRTTASPLRVKAPIEKKEYSHPYHQPRRQNITLGPVHHWYWPVRGKVIDGYSPVKGYKGIDIAGRRGEAIVAAASGIVVYAGSGLRAYGKLIIIKHNGTWLSAYAHNQTILVREGDRVRAHQKISTMGNTGSKRTMLHFEIRRNGKPVDPLRYLS